MGVIVPRTVTRFRPAGTSVGGLRLSAFRDAPFYVLLGEPGAGKTTVFELEADVGDESLHLPAREFVLRHQDPKPEWRGKTLFIDGLDEVRAGSRDVRKALDSILGGLDRLGQPSARLSCRSAAWLATNDLKAIRSIGYQDPLILHLDPLTGQEAREILVDRMGDAAENFFAEARSRQLHALLENPLSIKLLIKAVGPKQGWPDSRVETFERACLALVAEENHEHAAASRCTPARPSDALAAASWMAVLFLLADKEAIAWDRTDASEPDDLLVVGEIDSDLGLSPGQMRRALDSGLFVFQTPGTSVPLHPHVAEYLAARHLTSAIEGGALLARVLTLLTAGDGVPSALRGVAAWLAALCPDARRTLLDADPVGVVAYGDVSVFDDKEGAHLLSRLAKHDDPNHYPENFADTSLVGLVNPQTLDVLRRFVNALDRSESVRRAMALLLAGISAAPSRCRGQFLAKDLLAVVRDETWSRRVRTRAAYAATMLSEVPGENCDAELLRLLRDIGDGSIGDPGNDIRILLVRHLYPERIPPKDVWHWIPVPVPSMLHVALVQDSSPEHCSALLDALLVRTHHPEHVWDSSVDDLAWKLLARALEVHGECVAIAKLYDWLELAAFDRTSREWEPPQDDEEESGQALLNAMGFDGGHDYGDSILSNLPSVRAWLAQRPSMQKKLLLELLGRDGKEVDLASRAGTFWQLVSRDGRPMNFESWCLQQALSMSRTAENSARWLVMHAVEPLRRSMPADEWLPNSLERVADDPILTDQLRSAAEHDRDIRRRELTYQTRRSDHKNQLANPVMEHRDALLAGTGPTTLLVSLGQTYWSRSFDDQPMALESLFKPAKQSTAMDGLTTGEDRLRFALAPRPDAAKVALQALMTVPTSERVPDLSKILELDGKGQSSTWALPFLAGMDALSRQGEPVLEVLGTNVEVAVWFYLTTAAAARDMPTWFADLLQSDAPLVAKVLVELHRNRIRSKRDDTAILDTIRADQRYHRATILALPDLLKAFPAKGYGAQLPLLRQVLVLAVRYMPEEVASRVRNRMSCRCMNIAQRIAWLGAGMAVAPNEFIPSAVAVVQGGRAARIKHLTTALLSAKDARGHKPLFDATVKAANVASLVRVLGAKHWPYWEGIETDAAASFAIVDIGSELVEQVVECLANNPSHSAGLELESLLGDRKLEAWRNTIRGALNRQRVLHRDTEHSVPTVEQVQRVLSGGPPANAADLAALVVDQLERLGQDIRHGDTDDWQQYWNERRGRGTETPPKPKNENACRDALLSALRRRLPVSVDARREASYAEYARADVRVCYGPFGVPIEVKKGDDRKLWSAIRDQLIAKYVRDPESDGHGIYLVLWFGAYGPAPVKTPPTGPRPQSPGELARRLQECLSQEERSRIKVVVIDVGRPATR